jgi:hypothetical protein
MPIPGWSSDRAGFRLLSKAGDEIPFTMERAGNPPTLHHVFVHVGERGPSVMFQKIASTAFVVGTLLTASIPAIARDHGGHSGSGRGGFSGRSAGSSRGQSFSGGGHYSAPRGFSGGSHYSGGQSFVAPRGYEGRRGYSGGTGYYGRGYIAPRVYRRPYYGGYYGGGLYLGFGAPYAYAYDPGYYYYDPGYAGAPVYSYPAPAPQSCTGGSYDQYGNWIPDPNCNSGQPQYQQQAPQNYPQQYPQTQQDNNYDPQQYPPAQQNYNPNPPQYNR